VWEDQIFITTAIQLDEKATEEAIKRLKKATPGFGKLLGASKMTENLLQFVVFSINRETGEVNWKKIVREQLPHEGIHAHGSWASQSCVTDGEHIIAYFGSYGIYCFNMKGNLIWEKDLGDTHMEMAFGEGTSPVLYKNKLVIVWDQQDQSKIYVLDKNTGNEIWQKNREEHSTWATPVVTEVNGSAQIIVPGREKSIAYNIETGEEIWFLDGLSRDIIPSPVSDGKKTYLMTGFMASKKVIQAIDLKTAKGNLENSTALTWTGNNSTPYVSSPLVKNGKIYFLKGNRAQISCVDTKTGKYYYDGLKIEGMKSAYASPVAANGNIYIIDRNGTCSVIKEGTELKVIAQNSLDDKFDASPAIAGNILILRGFKSLYCIAE
jgi:outer membrane protein assembly factor BamB